MLKRTLALAAIAWFVLPLAAADAFGPATSISVSPATLTVTADQSVALTVTAKDAANDTQDVTGGSVFTVSDPRGNFSAHTYNAGKVGSWMITVTYQGLQATVPVTVTAGALAELAIVPDSQPEIIPLNRNITFAAQGFDADNNRISTGTVTWSTSPNLGSISARGVFTPSTQGTGIVAAAVGPISKAINVQVVAARVDEPDTNSRTNTNSATNTNGTSNANTNSAVNENTNAPANSNVNAPATPASTDSQPCSARSNWLWGVLLLALLGGIAVLYAFVPVTKTWPPIVGLAAAVALSIVERKYGCAANAWWPWIAILGSAGLTVFAFQQTPKSQTPSE